MTHEGHDGPADTDLRAGRTRRALLLVTAVLAVALVATVLVVTDDDSPSSTGTTTTTATAGPSTSTSSTTSTAVPPPAEETAVWPQVGGRGSTDAVAAARSFATDYLGFRDPIVGPLQAGDTRSGEIQVRPSAQGPVTTVLVRRLSGDDTWSVLGAATADIELTSPGLLDPIGSPVTVRGAGRAFEGNILVEVRDDDATTALGSGFVTGGGDILRPFEGRIDFRAPSTSRGALVLYTTSAEDGRVWQAAVLRVSFRDRAGACGDDDATRPGADEMTVTVWFSCDGTDGDPRLGSVTRIVPRSPRVLTATLGELLAGPTAAERSRSLSSWFSTATKDMLRSVSTSDGRAVVDLDGDLRQVISGASSSAGSARLLAELDANVFQFPSVQSAEYRLDGSCEAFTEWVQIGGCEPRRRPEG